MRVDTVQRKEQGVERVLIDAGQLRSRVAELAAEIDGWYDDRTPVMVGVLNGAALFMTDLMKCMQSPVLVDYMAVSSYGTSTQSSGIVQILKDLSLSIEGRDLLVVEDIVDSGLTLQYLIDVLERRNPASIRVVALLRKDKPNAIEVEVDLVGFDIPDEFVVGYGLDFCGLYRNLPYVGVLSQSAIVSK